MVEIIDLRDEDPSQFYKMLTITGQDSLDSPEGIVLGLKEDGKPAGAIAMEPDEDGSGKLTSLYVEPECRRKGYGTELVYRAHMHLIYTPGLNRIEASFARKENEGEDLEAFFRWLDFSVNEDEEHGAYSVKLKDAAEEEVIARGQTSGVMPFSKATSVIRNRLMAEHTAIASVIAGDFLDRDMSCFVDEENPEDELPDCLIFGKDGEDLVMMWAKSENNKMNLIKMLKHAVDEGIKKYGPDQVIRIPYINDNSKKLIEKLMGEKAYVSETVLKCVFSFDGEMEPLTEEDKEIFGDVTEGTEV